MSDKAKMLIAGCGDEAKDIFYRSSFCLSREEIKESSDQGFKEYIAIPANAQDGYSWQKLFSEILTQYFAHDADITPKNLRAS